MTLDAGVLFSALVTLTVAVVLLWMAFETWTLATGREPITWYTRLAVQRWSLWTNLACVVVAALWAHFIWDSACR